MKGGKKRIYCYVDETGQDVDSEYFIVVAVVTSENQEQVRRELIQMEKRAIMQNPLGGILGFQLFWITPDQSLPKRQAFIGSNHSIYQC